MKPAQFRNRLLAWYDRHGRQDLPWKRVRDPYHVWVSEIMLQQTQVTTVIPYFERFIARFPNVAALAHADINEVLHQWSGLGYYARARYLHQAAGEIMARHHGVFPADLDAVRALPGIGRTTAAAILALAFDQRHAILDGNVKRVLTRYHAIAGPLMARDTEAFLWDLADTYTPSRRTADYTQAIMDLGATLCRRTEPACEDCPVRYGCRARRAGNPHAYPVTTPRKRVPTKRVHMLIIRDSAGQVLLLRRPPAGIWGGLWGFPETPESDVQGWCRHTLGFDIALEPSWPVLKHAFSHFRLDITPVPARVIQTQRLRHCAAHAIPAHGKSPDNNTSDAPAPNLIATQAMENGEAVWYNVHEPDERGLAAPVKRLLEQLR